MRAFHLLFIVLGLIPAVAAAAPFEDLAALDALVAATVGAPAGTEGGAVTPIDRRLKLAACPGGAVAEPMGQAVTVRCPAIGWRLRVPLSAGGGGGAVVSPQQSVAPVVRRGDPVELIAGGGSFSVSSQVVAQEDGRPGARIRVRADPRSPIVIAEVAGPGQVRLPGFK